MKCDLEMSPLVVAGSTETDPELFEVSWSSWFDESSMDSSLTVINVSPSAGTTRDHPMGKDVTNNSFGTPLTDGDSNVDELELKKKSTGVGIS